MTMNFIAAKNAVVNLLEQAAAGRYRVVSYEPLPMDAKDFEGSNRTVRAFYGGGSFPKTSLTTPTMHDINMTLELVVTASSETDLGVFNDPNSTDAQRAAAMAGTTPAALLADSSFDEFASILWNVIMEPKNQWLGMDKYTIGNRWVSKIEKDRLIPVGEQCILTGFIELEFNLEETSVGDTPFDFEYNTTEFKPNGDTVQKTEQRT